MRERESERVSERAREREGIYFIHTHIYIYNIKVINGSGDAWKRIWGTLHESLGCSCKKLLVCARPSLSHSLSLSLAALVLGLLLQEAAGMRTPLSFFLSLALSLAALELGLLLQKAAGMRTYPDVCVRP